MFGDGCPYEYVSGNTVGRVRLSPRVDAPIQPHCLMAKKEATPGGKLLFLHLKSRKS